MDRLENVNVNKAIQAELPTFKRLLTLLGEKFKPPVVTPEADINTVMYQAGQYSVLLHFSALVKQAEEKAVLEQSVIKP